MNDTSDNYAETEDRIIRIKRRDIGYLQFIFEAYDGVATVSTVDPEKGIIRVSIPESRLEDATLLLQSLEGEIGMEYLQGADDGPV